MIIRSKINPTDTLQRGSSFRRLQFDGRLIVADCNFRARLIARLIADFIAFHRQILTTAEGNLLVAMIEILLKNRRG